MYTRNELYNRITAHVAEAVYLGFSQFNKKYNIYSHYGRMSIIVDGEETYFDSTDELISFIYAELMLSA